MSNFLTLAPTSMQIRAIYGRLLHTIGLSSTDANDITDEVRRGSPTDATDYHRFLISARNIRVMLMITAFYCYICFTHHQKACFSFISTISVIHFIINVLSTCKINLSSLKQHETTKVLLRLSDELILRQRKQITNN